MDVTAHPALKTLSEKVAAAAMLPGKGEMDPVKRPTYQGFASAMNAVGFRQRGAREHAADFGTALDQPDTFDSRYKQSHHMFCFFCAAVSAVESFYYAMYGAASVVWPIEFPMATLDDLRFYPRDVVKDLNKKLKGQPTRLTTMMDAVLNDPAFKMLADNRVAMFHRLTPPRAAFMSNGGPPIPSKIPSNPRDPPSAWKFDLDLHPRMLDAHAAWLDKALTGLVEAAADFATNHLK